MQRRMQERLHGALPEPRILVLDLHLREFDWSYTSCGLNTDLMLPRTESC